VAIKWQNAATDNLTPEMHGGRLYWLDKVFTKVLAVVLLLSTIAHLHSNICNINIPTDGCFHKLFPRWLEVLLIGWKQLWIVQVMCVFKNFYMCNVLVLGCDFGNENPDKEIKARSKDVV
jgi:hypothetical protein